ncbi:hypothetical protein ACLE20_02735 [Rhizobium sp. YIM 134829]|uniref:hypothetical protein n=1 Tax=Rhizobium sp. YIM 134829 TaxID=3390453 RepID=UPI00397E4E0F
MSGETPQRSARCPLCRARGLQPTTRCLSSRAGRRSFPYACSHCGLLLDEAGRDEETAQAFFHALVSRGTVEARADDPIGFDLYTLRTLASRFDFAALPADAAQAEGLRHPHAERAAHGHLVPLEVIERMPVSVGVICGERDLAGVLDRAEDLRPWARELVVLVDRQDEDLSTDDDFLTILSRPLAGDFAAQRNALQAQCKSPWVLQLDADESLSDGLGLQLPRLATLAEQQGAVSIGLPRENLVGGALSDLYPDIQYRLNRRDVRFEGVVHERPVRPWQASFIALSGCIRHHLNREHVEKRSTTYESLSPGGGRLFETAALTRAYSSE